MPETKRSKNVHRPEKEVTSFDAKLFKTVEHIGTDMNHKRKILWFPFALTMITVQVCGMYGIYLCLFKCLWTTTIFSLLVGKLSGLGVTVGAHRLFSHRSFKANTAARLVLVILFVMAGQFNLYKWVLIHRQHHKFSDTDADPHNSREGFFFGHLGWIVMSQHPTMVEKRKTIDMTDLDKDPIVMFQKRYYFVLFPILSVILPVGTTMYFFNETFWNAFFVAFWFRYMISLHNTWLINSATHVFEWGNKPYNKHMHATQNRIVSLLTLGEGSHNYHHAFPWDYRSEENDVSYSFNPTKFVIDMFARIGWAYDLKVASEDMIRKTIHKSGDGTHRFANELERLR